MLWAALHFPSPGQGLEPLAAWACQFTPKVSLEPPRALLLELAGSLRYFEGLETLLQLVERGCGEMDVPVCLATAATPRAALWLARSGKAQLEDVPLEASGFDSLFFKNLGLSTIGDLRKLPRDGLARRCGQALVDDLDRALGALPEPREYFTPPARFAAQLELPAPVAHAEALLFAARRLLVQLEGLLRARHEGVRAFTLVLDQKPVHVGLASPTRETTRFTDVLREKLTTLVLAQPVEILGIEARDFEPLHGRSRTMFEDAAAEAEDWSRLLERLRARLGRDAVQGLATQPDHRPELAWRSVEPGEWDPREFTQPGPRPIWLVEPPRRLREGDFLLLTGPERIEAGWWDGDDARRDYFIASIHEALAWIYREKDQWFLHGLFA
jgi:protein ImuB